MDAGLCANARGEPGAETGALNTVPSPADTSRMSRQAQSAFTLVELVVAMAVAGILLGVGVPSFVELVRDGKLQSAATEMNMALYYARSEAVKRAGSNGNARSVTVCARATDLQCAQDETEWNNGWLVFTDNVFANADEHASVDPGDQILRVVGAPDDAVDVLAVGSSNRTAAGATRRSYVRYRSQGDSNWQNGYVAFCDERAPERWRALNVAITGDIRPARGGGSDARLVNAFNQPITGCDGVES